MKQQNRPTVKPVWYRGYLYIRPANKKATWRVIIRGANHEALQHSQVLHSWAAVLDNCQACAKALGGGSYPIPTMLEANTIGTGGRIWTMYDPFSQALQNMPPAAGATLTDVPISLEQEPTPDQRTVNLFSGLATWLTSIDVLPVLMERDEQVFYKLIGKYMQENGLGNVEVGKEFPAGINWPHQPTENGIL